MRAAPIVVESVAVLPHAVRAARRRIVEFRGMQDSQLQAVIADRVREGCARGQVFDRKPRPFCGSGERTNGLPPGQRVVTWGESGFVIDIGMLPRVTVVTTLKRLERIQVPGRAAA